MLKNRYQEILIGMGLMSLVRGIISLKRNRSTLLIDDYRFKNECYHFYFLSELEISSLIRLGRTYEIPELINLREFLLPATIELVSNENRLKLGHSPFENLRELLRKFPDLIEQSDLDLVYAENPEEFNRSILEEIKRYELLAYETSIRPKVMRFELQGPKWLKQLYSNFNRLINQEYTQSYDLKYSTLLHLVGLSAEDKLKTSLPPEEAPFYFFRMLSPVWRLNDFYLSTQLKRRLLMLGGDVKESTVQFWQFHERKFENLLLASFEGVISGERVLFFGHLPEAVPFKVQSPFPILRKTQLQPAKRSGSPFPANELYFISHKDQIGSDRPYRVLLSRSGQYSYYHQPYPELPGSKAEFYERELRDNFSFDARTLLFAQTPSEASGIQGVTLDMRELREKRKSEISHLTPLPIEIVEENRSIKGFEYWGPFRYKGLGLLATCYGVEGI